MTQYYFRVYKRNKEFKSRKSIESLSKFLKIFFLKNINEKFFLKKNLIIVNYSSEFL